MLGPRNSEEAALDLAQTTAAGPTGEAAATSEVDPTVVRTEALER